MYSVCCPHKYSVLCLPCSVCTATIASCFILMSVKFVMRSYLHFTHILLNGILMCCMTLIMIVAYLVWLCKLINFAVIFFLNFPEAEVCSPRGPGGRVQDANSGT